MAISAEGNFVHARKAARRAVLAWAVGAVCVGLSTEANAEIKYEVVVDAGSGGSRVFVYQIDTEKPLHLLKLYEDGVNTPLADPWQIDDHGIAHRKNASEINKSIALGEHELDGLLKKARQEVPVAGKVSLSVLGTAGMRDLAYIQNENAAYDVYRAVDRLADQAGYATDVNSSRTIDGREEGLFAWEAVNYLAGTFTGQGKSKGIVEVGGASAQVAVAVSGHDASLNARPITINGRTFDVYSVSFQGLGAKRARLAMLESDRHNACSTGVHFNFEGCELAYEHAYILAAEQQRALNQDLQTTAKALAARDDNAPLYGLGGVFFALSLANPSESVYNQDFAKNVQEKCDQANMEDPYNTCATATFVYTLAVDKLHIGAGQLQGVEKMKDAAQPGNAPIKPSWTVGYLINKLWAR